MARFLCRFVVRSRFDVAPPRIRCRTKTSYTFSFPVTSLNKVAPRAIGSRYFDVRNLVDVAGAVVRARVPEVSNDTNENVLYRQLLSLRQRSPDGPGSASIAPTIRTAYCVTTGRVHKGKHYVRASVYSLFVPHTRSPNARVCPAEKGTGYSHEYATPPADGSTVLPQVCSRVRTRVCARAIHWAPV